MRAKALYLVECKVPRDLREPGLRYVKIGISTRPHERLKTLQIGNPFPLQIIFTAERIGHAPALERLLHRFLDADMCRQENPSNRHHQHWTADRTEWFMLTTKQVEQIREFCNSEDVVSNIMPHSMIKQKYGQLYTYTENSSDSLQMFWLLARKKAELESMRRDLDRQRRQLKMQSAARASALQCRARR